MKTIKFHTTLCRNIMMTYVYNDDNRTLLGFCIFGCNLLLAASCLLA